MQTSLTKKQRDWLNCNVCNWHKSPLYQRTFVTGDLDENHEEDIKMAQQLGMQTRLINRAQVRRPKNVALFT
jgi:hypothetical protein